MNIFLFVAGLFITLLTIYDMILTILSPRGAGLVADRISRGVWRVCLMATGRDGRNNLLRFVGPMLLLIVVLNWIILLWIGNTLIVYSDSEALWSSANNTYVTGFIEKMYFIAYVLSSMGSGDFTPSGDWWMFYTGFISYTGLVFISLGISFLIPVVEAITLKRQLSLRIHNLGRNPKEILERYDKNKYKELLELFSELEPDLLTLAQYHLAYPVIHYFHSKNLFESIPVKFVTLDETMSIMLYRIQRDNLADVNSLERSYSSMSYYLSTLATAFIKPDDDEPKRPETTYLSDAPKDSTPRGTSTEQNLIDRRKLLLAYLQNDGWGWEHAEKGDDTIEFEL